MTDTEVDVLVVGQGVVGQFLSLLLAGRGHRVLAVERHPQPYTLPRAVHYDPDVNRMLAGLGIDAAEQAAFSEPALSYDWLTADGRVLLTFPTPVDGDQGWPESTMFAQPELEKALRRRQSDAQTLELRWGTAVEGLVQDEQGVTATLVGPSGTEVVRASFVVGCDGANSTVRDILGIEMEDLGFSSDWLVMDLKTQPREWTPVNGQICDPRRPTSCVCGGPGRRRFEFMRMPDDGADFATEASAWELVAPWDVRPDNAELERLAMYTFHARCARTWSDGRIFLAGDAAHRMPPFYGRGMVSGARDAMNLAWKLDAVLAGSAPLGLLDTYGSERFAHVQFSIGMSVALGRVICETEPEAVAARDAHFLEKGPLPWDALPPMPAEVLGPGFFPHGTPGDDPVAGRIGQQHPLLGPDGQVALLDAVTFGDWQVLVDMRQFSVADADAVRGAKPAGIGARVIEIVPPGADRPNAHSGEDVTGRYGALFDQVGAAVVVYRPDFHGFGSSATLAGALELVAAMDPSTILVPEA